jgi:hypothetical protein
MFYGCQEDFANEESQEYSPATRAASDSSEDYYWLGNEKIPLLKMDNKFYIMYEPVNEGKLKADLMKAGTVLNNVQGSSHSQYTAVKSFDAKKFTGLKTATIEGDYEKIAPALSHAFYSAPYYKTDIGEGQLTNRFSIALKQDSDVKLLTELAKENSVEILGVSELDGWYELACTNRSTGNALEMANMFYETGLFASVGYDLGARGRLGSINEPLYTNGTLWHLGNNTTNSNVHINYIAARAIVPQVSSSIKIAVIDSGVQYGHPDLYNVLPGYDAHTDTTPNQVRYYHGTFVTGFIAAEPNNGEAVAGIAYGATVLPISIGADSYGNITSSYDKIVSAIDYAKSNGAKVINCSWAYSDNRVVNAVKRALDSGCIVVFCSMNSNGAIPSPANSDPRIIVVGAVNKNGTKASFSNYGSQLDVVAPGDGVTSTTTGSGYAYYTDSGTSYAAPQVAGIAALILSAYPNFTPAQVSNLITSTASNYRWNNQTGYGLVNAYKALIAPLTISGFDYYSRNTNVTYTIPAPPTGTTFNGWSIHPADYTTTGGTNSRTLNIKFLKPQGYTLTARFTLPNGSPLNIQKIINYIPPAPSTSVYPNGDGLYIAHEDDQVTLSVPDPQSGDSYEWRSNEQTVYQYDHTINGNALDRTIGAVNVKYRIIQGAAVSEWSNLTSVFFLSQSGFPLTNAPAVPIITMQEDLGLDEVKIIVNTRQINASYDWMINGYTFNAIDHILSLGVGGVNTIKCRARIGSGVSAWSNEITF